MDLICDTNIWYDIADGKFDARSWRSKGHRLLATPVSVLEIASKLTDKTLPNRRGAAKAILRYADHLFDEPERHLAALWSLESRSGRTNWRDGIKAIAGSTAMVDLTSGIPDFGDRLLRRVDHNLAHQFRDTFYRDFETQVITTINMVLPGYAAARAVKKTRSFKKEELAAYRASMMC